MHGAAPADIQPPWAYGIRRRARVTTTTTGASGPQADIVLFSLVRNNKERNVGAAGALHDVNVTNSRSREKMVLLGNFDTMLNGNLLYPAATEMK